MRVAHTQELKDKAFELRYDGMKVKDIAEQLGIHTNYIYKYAKPDTSAPDYIDEVSISRALGGDRMVYLRMTPKERKEFWNRHRVICEKTPMEEVPTDTGSYHYNPAVKFMADCFGISSEAVQKSHSRYL